MKLVDSKIRVQVSITMSLSLPAMHVQLVHERVKVGCCNRAVEIFRCMATAVFHAPLRVQSDSCFTRFYRTIASLPPRVEEIYVFKRSKAWGTEKGF